MFQSKLYIYLPIIFFFLFLFNFQTPSLTKTVIIYTIILVSSFLTGLFFIKTQFKKYWPFLIEIILLLSSALLFFLFSVNEFWRFIFVLIFCFIFALFSKYIYTFFHQPRLYTPYGLQELSGILNFVIGFWALTGIGFLSGWDPFTPLSLISLILVYGLFFWFSYYTWSNQPEKIFQDQQSYFIDFLIISLVITGLYLAINFLPLGPHFNALIISIFYFIIITLWLKNQKKLSLTT